MSLLRKATTGNTDPRPDQPAESTAGGFSIKRVIVQDTILDLSKRENFKSTEQVENIEELEKITAEMPPLDFSAINIIKAPRNSILGYEIDPEGSIKTQFEEENRSKNTKLKLYYPFFSSHISLPLKPGEHVFVLDSENPLCNGYWMSRISSPDHVEDVCYTHYDRRLFEIGQNEADPDEEEKPVEVPRGFPNGGSLLSIDPELEIDPETDEDELELFVSDDREFYEKIVSESPESGNMAFEPVPRYTKRPGDLVFQGSNNTLICLGTDRGDGIGDNSPDKEISNANSDSVDPFEGSIDIVCGRGRLYSYDEAGNEDLRSRPRAIENTREEFETDKNPSENPDNNLEDNRFFDFTEGDPDFINDAARIYVSSKSFIDQKLGTTSDVIPAPIGSSLNDSEEDAVVALKSDRVRIVSRKTGTDALKDSEYSDTKEINGDIRIIKQGNLEEDACCVYLLEDGTVQVSGSKIVIGRTEGQTSSSYGGAGEFNGLHPYVRFADLKKLLEEVFKELDAFANTLTTHVTPGNGAPSPQITQAASTLMANLATIKSSCSNFQDLASERIFGE